MAACLFSWLVSYSYAVGLCEWCRTVPWVFGHFGVDIRNTITNDSGNDVSFLKSWVLYPRCLSAPFHSLLSPSSEIQVGLGEHYKLPQYQLRTHFYVVCGWWRFSFIFHIAETWLDQLGSNPWSCWKLTPLDVGANAGNGEECDYMIVFCYLLQSIVLTYTYYVLCAF